VSDDVDENDRMDRSAPAEESDAQEAPDDDDVDISLIFLSLLTFAMLFMGLEWDDELAARAEI